MLGEVLPTGLGLVEISTLNARQGAPDGPSGSRGDRHLVAVVEHDRVSPQERGRVERPHGVREVDLPSDGS